MAKNPCIRRPTCISWHVNSVWHVRKCMWVIYRLVDAQPQFYRSVHISFKQPGFWNKISAPPQSSGGEWNIISIAQMNITGWKFTLVMEIYKTYCRGTIRSGLKWKWQRPWYGQRGHLKDTCQEGRNLFILLAAGGGRVLACCASLSSPFSLTSPPPVSSHHASPQCPRPLNQRLHNVKITHYRSLHYASSLLPAWHRTGWPTEVCLYACK